MNDLSKRVARIIHGDPHAKLALEIIAKLRAAGYVAFLAGGCVRDALVGRAPKDYDVATSAHPDEVQALFGHRRTLAVGAAFGVICVLGNRREKTDQVEVATFRSDGPYTDGRRPDSVLYSSPEQDAARRDFTINGLFFDPATDAIIDFVGGCDDLQKNQLRAIGDPHARFREDKLRLLRAVRFATTYDFAIEETTWQAIREHAPEVTVCSGERIGGELRRMLTDINIVHGLQLLASSGLANAVMPHQLANSLNQTNLAITGARLSHLPKEDFASRLAILLLNIKDNHSEILEDLSTRWRLSNEDRDAVAASFGSLEVLVHADQVAWSVLQPHLIHRYRNTSVAVASALLKSDQPNQQSLERLEQALALPPETLDPRPLLTGEDLIAAGFRPNPKFKSILNTVRAMQLDGQISSRQEALQVAHESK